MSRMIRSRRAPAASDLPLYGRMLGLRHLAPSGFLCFVFLEGAVALGILLALAELVSWWGVIVLPITVAAMVKLNDLIAHMIVREGVEPDTAVMIGDREFDVRAATRHGIPTVGVTWGYGTVEELTAAGAATLCHAPGTLAQAAGGPLMRPRVSAAGGR